jgi:hypothetical protein
MAGCGPFATFRNVRDRRHDDSELDNLPVTGRQCGIGQFGYGPQRAERIDQQFTPARPLMGAPASVPSRALIVA